MTFRETSPEFAYSWKRQKGGMRWLQAFSAVVCRVLADSVSCNWSMAFNMFKGNQYLSKSFAEKLVRHSPCSLCSGVIIFKTWNYYAMKWSNLAGNFQLGLNITVYKWKAVVSLINNPQQRWNDYFFLQQLVVAIDWLWKAANIKDKKKTAAVYVGSSITVHNPWFFVHKWKRNKLMPRFYWSIRPK